MTVKRARVRWASVYKKKLKKFQPFWPGQSESQERLPGKGGLTQLDYFFHVNASEHLTAKGLPAAVIQPGLKTRGRVKRPLGTEESGRYVTRHLLKMLILA